MKVLCVHGIGGHEPGGDWEGHWQSLVRDELGGKAEIAFCHLDALFDTDGFTLAEALKAAALLGQGLLTPGAKGVGGGLVDRTLAMVGQWLNEPARRKRLREHLAARIALEKPQLLVAHSLGSLVAFDCFNEAATADAAKDLHFIAIGSQIGNRAVWPCFGGRLEMPRDLLRFTQLYRRDDPAFTVPIPLAGDQRFLRIELDSGLGLPVRHGVAHYLPALSRVRAAWGDWLPSSAARGQLRRALKQALTDRPTERARLPATARAPRRRALLVGINEYLNPATAWLKGCVNDAWLMSALLQEYGFDAGEIRMVLNHRATAQGLQERLDWLVDDARPGDTCVFYYSGHGAQLPVYGNDGQHVVGVLETLVPHDFDWSQGQALSDRQFSAFYSQLPYGLNFLAIFDCCHSGGMTRGGAQRIRGVEPPDDVRHRMLKWSPERQMWVTRELGPANTAQARKLGGKDSGPLQRLGHSLNLRGDNDVRALKQLAARYGHRGPYMPTLLYASSQDEFSYEYDHGPISYGAYTYCLVKRLRALRSSGQLPSFAVLVEQVRAELAELGYAQTPLLAAPTHIKAMPVPLQA